MKNQESGKEERADVQSAEEVVQLGFLFYKRLLCGDL
jgi:hypothetical protein